MGSGFSGGRWCPPGCLREIPGRSLEISGEWCAQTQRGPRDGPSRDTRRWWVKHRSVLTDFTTLFHFLPGGFSPGYIGIFPGLYRDFPRAI